MVLRPKQPWTQYPSQTQRSRSHKESSPSEKLVAATVSIAAIILSYSWFARSIGGTYYYVREYIRAVFGDDALEDACASVLLARNPKKTLVDRDWYKLQRCLGNRDGFYWQGETFIGLYDGVWYLLSFLTYFGPLFTLSFLAFMGLWVFPHIFTQIRRFLSFVASSPIQVLVMIFTGLIIPILLVLYVFFYGPIFWVSFVAAVIGVILVSSANHAEDPGAWTWTNLFQPFTILFNGLLAAINYLGTIANSWANLSKCHHVDPCTCPTTLLDENARLNNSLQHALEEIEHLRVLLNLSEEECAALKRTNIEMTQDRAFWRSQGHNVAPEWWDATPTSPTFPHNQTGSAGTSQRAERDLERLRKDYDDLINEKRVAERNLNSRITSLQAQLSYAQGDGNATQVREEVDALKAKERHLKKQVNTLNTNLMHATQKLNYERTHQSHACRNEAACSTKIRELEEQRQVLFKMHEDNDIMVQEAAKEFGKSEAEARHYTLKTYLQEITEAMVRQIAAGNLINPDDKPIFSSILNKMDKVRIQEITEYKDRLEMEVHRLGGDVKLMRLGLDPKCPAPTRELTYENNANTVFPIYQGLFQKVTYLEAVLVEANIRVPVWVPETPRSDFYNKPSYLAQDWNYPRAIKEVPNARYENHETLLQSLLQTEISRLVNRGIALKSYIEQQPPGSGSFWNDKVQTPLRDAEAVFENALFHILDDARPLEKRHTSIEDTSLLARADRRFKIWLAMQQAIHALTKAITTFNCHVPPWSIDLAQPAPNLVFRKTFEALATNLMKFEVNTREHRIDELLLYIEYNKLPGTAYGAPRQSGPPGYQADFDALKAARLYALLCKDHWADEVADPTTEKPIRLPLDHPPLIHALLQKPGEVMVPKKTDYGFVLTKDGKPARITDITGMEVYGAENNKDKDKDVHLGTLAKEKEWYRENYDRVQQLIFHIEKSGKYCAVKPDLWVRKKDPDEAFLRDKKGVLTRWVRELQGWMKDEKVPVPKMMKNGGKMKP